MKTFLVVVHPGSACGSADMNLGSELAEDQRLNMQMFVQDWEGPVLVIDGALSDELERRNYRDWGRTLQEAVDRAVSQGQVGERLRGDDDEAFDQHCAMEALLKKHTLTPATTRFEVTGAWYESEKGGGCVGGVVDYLRQKGFEATIPLDAVMDLDAPEEEMDVDPPRSSPRF